MNQVRYDTNNKPTADYPVNKSFAAPQLPSSGIPWMVPKSDFFTTDKLNPEWSFLGYTQAYRYSLTDQPGWLRLSPKASKMNTLTKNDGEHNYSLITRLVFNAQALNDEAGLLILRGDEKSSVKLYSSVNDSSRKTIFFCFDSNKYEAGNTAGDTVWLKITRINHNISGYFSPDGLEWTKVGQDFNISTIDSYSDFSTFTGTRQGLYVMNNPAYFDFYIYRDAYTPILAECPANQYGTTVTSKVSGISSLDNIHDNDWALYAGVEFGGPEYKKKSDSLTITATSATEGGVVEVWLDSLDSGTKIAECAVSNTGSWTTYSEFTTNILVPVSGRHDVYLKFKGAGTAKLFMLKWLIFKDNTNPETTTSVGEIGIGGSPYIFKLRQNYPNPFNPSTMIMFEIPHNSFVSLKVYNLLGEQIRELAGREYPAGRHSVAFDASHLASGVYFYTIRLKESSFFESKKMFLIK